MRKFYRYTRPCARRSPKPLKGLFQSSQKSRCAAIFGKRSGRRNRRGGKHSAPTAMAPCRRRVGGASLRSREPTSALTRMWFASGGHVKTAATHTGGCILGVFGNPPKPLKGSPRRSVASLARTLRVRFRRVCQNGSHPYGWLPFWCARRESNPEPTASEAVTLSNCATDTYLR